MNMGFIYKHFDRLTPSQTAADHLFRDETKMNYRVRYTITKARLLVQAFYRELEAVRKLCELGKTSGCSRWCRRYVDSLSEVLDKDSVSTKLGSQVFDAVKRTRGAIKSSAVRATLASKA